MHWRKKLLEKSKLYLVLDASVRGYDELYTIAEQAIAGGVDIIQLRDKTGNRTAMTMLLNRLSALTEKKVLLIVNDDVELAAELPVDGAHIGQDDMSLSQARQILKGDQLIGVSVQEWEHCEKAQEADYIGFGSVFATQTKPKRTPMDLSFLSDVVAKIERPVFAIGGIQERHIPSLRACGITRVAVTRAIMEATNVKRATENLKHLLT